jgi:hypothetical protein
MQTASQVQSSAEDTSPLPSSAQITMDTSEVQSSAEDTSPLPSSERTAMDISEDISPSPSFERTAMDISEDISPSPSSERTAMDTSQVQFNAEDTSAPPTSIDVSQAGTGLSYLLSPTPTAYDEDQDTLVDRHRIQSDHSPDANDNGVEREMVDGSNGSLLTSDYSTSSTRIQLPQARVAQKTHKKRKALLTPDASCDDSEDCVPPVDKCNSSQDRFTSMWVPETVTEYVSTVVNENPAI